MTRPRSRFIAARFVRTRRREAGNASSFMAAAGIAVGVMTLTVVLAVMNGFQLGFMESIVEVSSYHLQVHAAAGGPALDESLLPRVLAVPGVRAVVPFVERQALVEAAYQRPRPAVLRAVPPDLLARDPSQAAHLVMTQGAFDLADPRDVVVGTEMAIALGLQVGDLLAVTSFAVPPGGRPVPRRVELRVTGIFETGYLDFDAGLAFLSLAGADAFLGNGAPLDRSWGVKIADRFADGRPLAALRALTAGTGAAVESWRTYNRSFFDALFVEKLMMLLLVGLIFVVVGVNVFHSLRRRVAARREEIALLKAVGVPPSRVRAVFLAEGLLIGVTGGLVGTAAGLLLAVNINGVFSLVDSLVNAAITAVRLFSAPFAPAAAGGFAVFSPTFFYLSSVPSRVLPREVALVGFFAVASCAAAALAASRAVTRFLPAEVLRYE